MNNSTQFHRWYVKSLYIKIIAYPILRRSSTTKSIEVDDLKFLSNEM